RMFGLFVGTMGESDGGVARDGIERFLSAVVAQTGVMFNAVLACMWEGTTLRREMCVIGAASHRIASKLCRQSRTTQSRAIRMLEAVVVQDSATLHSQETWMRNKWVCMRASRTWDSWRCVVCIALVVGCGGSSPLPVRLSTQEPA